MAETIEVELPGTGEPILDGGAELLFRREFDAEFARRMLKWWTDAPDAFAAAPISCASAVAKPSLRPKDSPSGRTPRAGTPASAPSGITTRAISMTRASSRPPGICL